MDSEGAVRPDKIVHVGEADKLSLLFQSESFTKASVRSNKIDKVFYSYAEMKDQERESVASILYNFLFARRK